jgi:hypothetical protein
MKNKFKRIYSPVLTSRDRPGGIKPHKPGGEAHQQSTLSHNVGEAAMDVENRRTDKYSDIPTPMKITTSMSEQGGLETTASDIVPIQE